MQKASFQAFLYELARGNRATCQFICRWAASHRSNLQLPDGIDLQLLPAYSPELNPVERLLRSPPGKNYGEY